MVSDMDTLSDHTITLGLRPFHDKPETGTRQAIDRPKDRLQMEQLIFTDTVQNIDSILDGLRMDRWDGSTEDTRNTVATSRTKTDRHPAEHWVEPYSTPLETTQTPRR